MLNIRGANRVPAASVHSTPEYETEMPQVDTNKKEKYFQITNPAFHSHILQELPMGRQILRASQWSWRSAVSLYSKFITVIFAFFCVVSGQIQKTANTGEGQKVIKGKVFNAADSSVLGNIKLQLCETAYPLYGMMYTGPFYFPVDSTTSNESGEFEITTNDSYHREFAMTVKNEQDIDGTKPYLLISAPFNFDPTKDSTYTLYLTPYVSSSVTNLSKMEKSQQMYAVQGKAVEFRLPQSLQNISASVVDVKGRFITSLSTIGNDLIRWNTESVAKGIYFVKIKHGSDNLVLKVNLR